MKREVGGVTKWQAAIESLVELTTRYDGSVRWGLTLFPDLTGGNTFLKRVVAVGPETVDIEGGQVHANGRPLAEPWANGPTLGAGHWELGPDEAFVLGDSRALSADDSRRLGPIAGTELQWKAVLRYWPPTRAGRPASL